MIPRQARRLVANGVTDYAGCVILGRNEPVTVIVTQVLVGQDKQEARILFGDRKAAAGDAALVNATSGHAHDFDDTGIGSHPAHPSVVLASAVFAVGEHVGATGSEMVGAYVVGYEVWCELARRDTTPHNVGGWHPSAVFGPLAASAAVANLMRLDADSARNALGIAASSACGLIGNFGSMTKPLHVGLAARAGIDAARLAKAGLTAAPDILEKDGGFLLAFSPEGEVDRTSPARLGKDWHILANGPNIKLYPVCYSIHGAVDAMLDLVAANRFKATDVASVGVELTPSQAANLYCHDPRDSTGAKFSAEYIMAAALLAARVSMTELDLSFIGRKDVRGLIGKVRPVTLEPETIKSRKPQLRISLQGGAEHIVDIVAPRGHSSNPPSLQDLWGKFSACVGDAMPPRDAQLLFDRLQNLETLAGIADLPLVASGPGAARARSTNS
jgi:2-methylcitrate dehydratase PrpD